MNVNSFLQKDYENKTTFRPKKTNPNKANFTYPQRGKTLRNYYKPQAPKTVDSCIEKVCKKFDFGG